MSLTLHQAIQLQGSIHALQNYKFSSKATFAIALSLSALDKEFPSATAKRTELLEALGNPTEKDDKFKIFVDQWQKHLEETTIDPKFTKIRYEELNIGVSDKQNHIPPALVASLFPILEDSAG